MDEAVIETRGLRKRFGSKLAVSDLSLTVRRGEVFGFLGPNGAGKTTSLKMLLCLVLPTGGEARLFGRPVSDRHVRSRVGFLPEHFRFHDWLTGREFLRFHGRLQGMNGPGLEKRIEELLVRVDLVEAASRKLREYSKGMLQRIGLAQALVHGPELVFLDEPTSGLDPLGRLLVRDMIKDLRAGGTAVFLNSHLLGEVEATCDRVVFIKAGRVIREMAMGEAETGIEVELRISPPDEKLGPGLAAFGEMMSLDGDTARLRVADDERLPEIAAWLTGRGTRLYEMKTVRRSLESLFLEVMGDDGRPG